MDFYQSLPYFIVNLYSPAGRLGGQGVTKQVSTILQFLRPVWATSTERKRFHTIMDLPYSMTMEILLIAL